MNRRQFIGGTSCFAITLGMGRFPVMKTHVVTLSFDDGLKKSVYKTAAIYEEFGLHGCFNVIAIGHEPGFHPTMNGVDDGGIVPFERGNFDDWNRIKRRGHEVMAHTYNHVNLTTIPFEQGKELIDKCADYFEKHLEGFKASESVYNFAYNASTPELDEYALTKFLVTRTQGDTPVNPIPVRRRPVRIGCWSQGPENCDKFLDKSIKEFLASPGGWFVFNTHGLDDEGWGPLSSLYLRSLLRRLTTMDYVEILPAGAVVQRLPA